MASKVPQVSPDGNYAMLPRDRVIKDLTDQQAFDLLRGRGGQTIGGRDPVHLTLERVWFTNIAAFLGLQRVEAGETEGLLDPNWAMAESPFVANHIFRIVMATVARISAAKPQIDVLPKTNDIEDQIGAKVGDYFLKHYDDQFNFRKQKRELGMWLATCGNAFIEADFNPKAGKKLRVYQNPFSGESIHPTQLSPQDKAWLDKGEAYEDKAPGKIEAGVLGPFQVFVPPGYTELDKMPWVIIEHDRSLEWLWDNYPDQAKVITPDELDATPEAQYRRRLATLVGRHGFSMPGRGDDYSEIVRVRTMWCRPSTRMPKGRKIVTTKSLVLENVPHPHHERMAERDTEIVFPIRHFRYCPVPGRFWAMGLVEHLLAPQREYNKTRQQAMQMRDILAVPQWLAPKTAELTSTRNNYGDIWEYSVNGGRPELVNPPALSQMHVEAQQSSLYDMQTISAQSEVSQSQVPTGVRSGIAIQALQEKDMSVMGIPVEELEDSWKLVSQDLLTLTDVYIDTPQMLTIYGEFSGADVMVHKGSDIKGNTRVRVAPGSMMPKSKAEQQSRVMDLMQVGALNPMASPRDRRMVYKTMFDNSDVASYFREEDQDRRRAEIENQMFLKPQTDQATGREAPYPDVNDDDDHQAHMEEHLVFKKSDAFERLPIMRKMAFEAHLAKHKEAIAQLMQTQALMAGMEGSGGGSKPKEPGKPSAPKDGGGAPGASGQNPGAKG